MNYIERFEKTRKKTHIRKLEKTDRCKKDGLLIICPHCGTRSKVYHLQWSSKPCDSIACVHIKGFEGWANKAQTEYFVKSKLGLGNFTDGEDNYFIKVSVPPKVRIDKFDWLIETDDKAKEYRNTRQMKDIARKFVEKHNLKKINENKFGKSKNNSPKF